MKEHPCYDCDRGGVLKPVRLPRYDFSAEAGMPVALLDVDVLKCDKCGAEVLDGKIINGAMNKLLEVLLQAPRRFEPQSAKFIRSSIGCTQEELAERMGIARETVARWESGEQDISVQNDFILRVMAIRRLQDAHARMREVLKALRGLDAVRTRPPKDIKKPLEVHVAGCGRRIQMLVRTSIPGKRLLKGQDSGSRSRRGPRH